MIVVTLASAPKPMTFNDLLESLELTKGNLSTHLRKLEAGKMIKIEKQFVDRKPLTTCKVTATGRKELEKYLTTIQDMLKLSQSGKKK